MSAVVGAGTRPGAGERGQASVELVGLVVAIVLVALLAIQGITVAQTASITQEAARHGARALSLGHDADAVDEVVERAVPDGLDLRDVRAVVDEGTARVRVRIEAPLGVAGAEVVDVTLTRTADFPMAGFSRAGED